MMDGQEKKLLKIQGYPGPPAGATKRYCPCLTTLIRSEVFFTYPTRPTWAPPGTPPARVEERDRKTRAPARRSGAGRGGIPLSFNFMP
jgi:hypothetical protein